VITQVTEYQLAVSIVFSNAFKIPYNLLTLILQKFPPLLNVYWDPDRSFQLCNDPRIICGPHVLILCEEYLTRLNKLGGRTLHQLLWPRLYLELQSRPLEQTIELQLLSDLAWDGPGFGGDAMH
jgi:hypothetical protein